MQKYIKSLLTGILIGAMIAQIINLAVQEWLSRPFSMGGDFLLPALLKEKIIGFCVQILS